MSVVPTLEPWVLPAPLSTCVQPLAASWAFIALLIRASQTESLALIAAHEINARPTTVTVARLIPLRFLSITVSFLLRLDFTVLAVRSDSLERQLACQK